MKLELEDGFNELEGATGGGESPEGEAERSPLAWPTSPWALEDLRRYEVGNLYVQDCPDLWEAAPRWVSITFFNHALITTLTALSRGGCC